MSIIATDLTPAAASLESSYERVGRESLKANLDELFERAFGTSPNSDDFEIDQWRFYQEMDTHLQVAEIGSVEVVPGHLDVLLNYQFKRPPTITDTEFSLSRLDRVSKTPILRTLCTGPVRYRLVIQAKVGKQVLPLPFHVNDGQRPLREVEVFDNGAIAYFDVGMDLLPIGHPFLVSTAAAVASQLR